MKKRTKKIITQIKGDNKQNLITKEFGVKQLEKVYYTAKDQIPQIPEIYEKIKESIKKNSDNANRITQFNQGRVDFHIHAVLTNRNDQILFRQHLFDIHNELKKKDEEYKEEVQRLKFQQQEMENSLKTQIESVAHQLKGLQPFIERRKIIIEQKKALEALIFKEQQIHQDELTNIHHELLDQREYYEKDLQTRLEIAENFAKTYTDLHIDALTKKIADSTTSKRRSLNSQGTFFLNELYNIDNTVKTANFYQRQNQILRKNIESTTAQIIKYKQEKKDTEIQMLQAISLHQEELSKVKDSFSEKEADITNVKMVKLLEENERLKKEASEAFELMKKAENDRIFESNSFQNDLLQKMNDAAKYIIDVLDKKLGATEDPLFLSHKTSMGKLIRLLTLIEKEVNKQTINYNSTKLSFYDTETIGTSYNSNIESERNSDLEMNADINDLAESHDILEYDLENSELNDINNTELTYSNSYSQISNYSKNYIDNDNNSYDEKIINNQKNINYNNYNITKTNNNEDNINENNDKGDNDGNDRINDKGNKNINFIQNKDIIEEHILKVDVEVQTEKPIRSKRLQGIKAPPTPPNYPYQFRSELLKTTPKSEGKIHNSNKKKQNYLYYTYTNKQTENENEIINGNVDDNENDQLNAITFKTQPPVTPISKQSRARNNLRNHRKNEKNGIENLNESPNLSRSLKSQKRKPQRHEYSATPEFKKISTSGRIPSVYIRIIQAPK